jgi:DoxX-like family
MKKNQWIYRISTGLLAVMMIFSAYSYFTSDTVKAGFVHLGFPDYFRIQLGMAKAIGAILLIAPAIPVKVKEFAYAGFGITFVSAFIAHTASGDPLTVAIAPLVFAIVLAVSYLSFQKLNKQTMTTLASAI